MYLCVCGRKFVYMLQTVYIYTHSNRQTDRQTDSIRYDHCGMVGVLRLQGSVRDGREGPKRTFVKSSY